MMMMIIITIIYNNQYRSQLIALMSIIHYFRDDIFLLHFQMNRNTASTFIVVLHSLAEEYILASD